MLNKKLEEALLKAKTIMNLLTFQKCILLSEVINDSVTIFTYYIVQFKCSNKFQIEVVIFHDLGYKINTGVNNYFVIFFYVFIDEVKYNQPQYFLPNFAFILSYVCIMYLASAWFLIVQTNIGHKLWTLASCNLSFNNEA